MINKFSYKKSKNLYITKNFQIKEHIAGSSPLRELYEKGKYDDLYLDTTIYEYAQKMREHFGVWAIITSGYRPQEYNNSINGATSSKHIEGSALDIQFKGIHPILVAMYAEEIGIKGIGLYAYSNNADSGWVHIDPRNTKYYWITPSAKESCKEIKTIMPTIVKGDRGYCVKILQRKLGLTADGICGNNTINTIYKKYGKYEVDKALWKEIFK